MRDQLLRRLEVVLYVAGLACLATLLWTVSERAWFQWRYRGADSMPAPSGAASPRRGPLGRIEIPRVGVSAVIFDGVEDRTLRRGVGHVPGTAYPGETGERIALAAHRDTFFRNLRLLRTGDMVRLVTHDITETYRVETTKVVAPWRTDWIQPAREDVLTLVTCFPFSYVGNAPERFVVQARRIARNETMTRNQARPSPSRRVSP
ncbi:MAG TPA: class D sortase [Bryobacteraceae bacterium]|nr:class D sortase [Bryobacteraceae bacterium]